MRTISPSTRFRKDLKREGRGPRANALSGRLEDALLLLQQDVALPERFCDHALSGIWDGYRDCHLWPDLVLIYRKPIDHTLELTRLGSHSELNL